jgi:diguanylate cyclase (GGDEF)-like protein
MQNSFRERGFSGGPDDQTGLGVFSDFHKSMVKELSRARRNSGTVTMGIMSIDTADSHLEKDAVVDIACAFQKQLRDFDTLDRYGSRELAFILPELRSAESVRVLERVIRESVAYLGARAQVPDLYIGLSCYPEDGASVERLIEMAEAAVNRAVEGSTPGVYRWTESGEESL